MTEKHTAIPVALTIAGSDSGGGAGIQADLKTFHAFGVFGTSAVTAVTVQNTQGVTGVHAIPLDVVRGQVDAVVADLSPAACKTGMLATQGLVRTVAAAIGEHGLRQYVLDPVMVATSGDRLLDEDAVESIVSELVPLAALVTPNLDEAAMLAGFAVETVSDMHRAAAVLLEAGAAAALVKGGHLRAPVLVDVLHTAAGEREFRRARMDTRHTHGTGCTLSAAVAAGLAHGRDLGEAVDDALDYVHRAMVAAPGLGRGHGPLNHLVPARPPAQPT